MVSRERRASRFRLYRLLIWGALLAGETVFAATQPVSASYGNEASPQTAWAACNANADNTSPSTFSPLSDASAASLVTHEPENRPSNVAANDYVPTSAQLQTFQSALDQYNQTPSQANAYMANVDGLDGLANPSTDDLIQWAAHKWGIPEDWLRAEYALESRWNQAALGDHITETAAQYAENPIQARVYGTTSDVFRSLGITQEGWIPGQLGAGTEPLRWDSTAFNIDYQAATVRFYYDNPQGGRTVWGDSSYVPCQQWNSIGGWYNPYPWNNSGQQNYVSTVQSYLSQQFWTSSDFNITTAPTAPGNLSLVSFSGADVQISWQPSSLQGGEWDNYIGYEIFRNGSSQALYAPITATSFDDTSIASGGTYTYQVAAIDENGNLSSLSNAITIRAMGWKRITGGIGSALGVLIH